MTTDATDKKVSFRPFSGDNVRTLADLRSTNEEKQDQAINELDTKVSECTKALDLMLKKREETGKQLLAFYNETMQSRPKELQDLADHKEFEEKCKVHRAWLDKEWARVKAEEPDFLRKHEELMQILADDAEKERLENLQAATAPQSAPLPKVNQQPRPSADARYCRLFVAGVLTGIAIGGLTYVDKEYLKKGVICIAAKIAMLVTDIFASISQPGGTLFAAVSLGVVGTCLLAKRQRGVNGLQSRGLT